MGWAYVRASGSKRLPSGFHYIAYGQYETIYDNYFYENEGNADIVYQKVASDTLSNCVGTREEKMKYLDEMEKNIAAFKKETAIKKGMIAAKAKADSICAARTSKARFTPNMVVSDGSREAMIIRYDCVKEVYYVSWLVGGTNYSDGFATLTAANMSSFNKTNEKYRECGECGGAGGKMVLYDVTTTKELPFDYFSGIRTTITKTVKEKGWATCKVCNGKKFFKVRQY